MGRADQLRAFRMRQAIGRLRRLVAPMTEVTATLASAAGRSNDDTADDAVAALLNSATLARPVARAARSSQLRRER